MFPDLPTLRLVTDVPSPMFWLVSKLPCLQIKTPLHPPLLKGVHGLYEYDAAALASVQFTFPIEERSTIFPPAEKVHPVGAGAATAAATMAQSAKRTGEAIMIIIRILLQTFLLFFV